MAFDDDGNLIDDRYIKAVAAQVDALKRLMP